VNTKAGRAAVALSPADPWRKCGRCGTEYMGVSACPECTTENAVDSMDRNERLALLYPLYKLLGA
jgi:hypothetical protein